MALFSAEIPCKSSESYSRFRVRNRVHFQLNGEMGDLWRERALLSPRPTSPFVAVSDEECFQRTLKYNFEPNLPTT
eukprot:2513931-Pleurochrysis_carterae.AAC.1